MVKRLNAKATLIGHKQAVAAVPTPAVTMRQKTPCHDALLIPSARTMSTSMSSMRWRGTDRRVKVVSLGVEDPHDIAGLSLHHKLIVKPAWMAAGSVVAEV